jgi:hypothetical protein
VPVDHQLIPIDWQISSENDKIRVCILFLKQSALNRWNGPTIDDVFRAGD